jgi:ATP-dependent exoDNAse (exonuclease V) alpha subunit
MEFQLTKNQQEIFDLIENTNNNYLVHGKPGVGKSVLINALTEHGNKSYTLCAPTGLAALNIGGKTLHVTFQIPVFNGIITPDYTAPRKMYPDTVNFLRFGLKHLIIDEISMVRADILDYIDRLLKEVKNSSAPFGGTQVIVVGDFYQLPPIINSAEAKQFKEYGYRSGFAFDAKCFDTFTTVSLNEVLRQKGDNTFIDLLHGARTGEVLPKYMVKLNERVGNVTDLRMRLVAQNKQSESINAEELRKLPGEVIEFHADSFGTWPAFPVDTVLTLKPGAQVIVKKNNADRNPSAPRGKFEGKVVNGTLGIVTEICEGNADEGEPMWVKIRMRNDEEVKIYRARWERTVREKNSERKWEERTVASFEQIPLALAWAISMHKSQGQTFESVHIDASKIFAAGQLYVALSRAKSLAGISLESRVSRDKFYANNEVIRFEKEMLSK